MSDMNDTQPTLVKDTQPHKAEKAPKGRARLLAILGLLLILALGGLAGYGSGIGVRRSAQATLVAQQVQEQYQLGLQAMQEGRYEVARMHLEFVIRNNPDYPGVQDAYRELLLRINITPTPTYTLTPTITPTPDLREAEAIYASAVEALNSSDWDAAVTHLDSLRRVAPTYRTVDVDGMYYIALRNRGVGKILAYRCQDINLEGGIYDITLAERFGPLDSTAIALRANARLYLTAASFWQLDWENARYYFGQVALTSPNMMDASCLTANERWRYATIQLAAQKQEMGDYCTASSLYEEAFTVYSAENEQYYPVATQVYYLCYGTPVPTATPTPLETPTSTP